jgi:hypothetical protein
MDRPPPSAMDEPCAVTAACAVAGGGACDTLLPQHRTAGRTRAAPQTLSSKTFRFVRVAGVARGLRVRVFRSHEPTDCRSIDEKGRGLSSGQQS